MCSEGYETIEAAEDYIQQQMQHEKYDSSDIRDESGERVDWPFGK